VGEGEGDGPADGVAEEDAEADADALGELAGEGERRTAALLEPQAARVRMATA
jgi:hypothetical protein